MPVDLFFSNRIEQLAADLAANLYPLQGEERLSFDPIQIVVPNRNLAKWLQLTLARRQGVSMNIDYAYLDTVLWDLLVKMSPAEVAPMPISQDIYALALLRVFENLPAEAAVFTPIRGYLSRGEGISPSTDAPAGDTLQREAHRWQLASKLAHLFQEYELNRPEWIPAWQAERFGEGGMTACQGHLYLLTLKVCQQLSDAVGQPLWTLPLLARMVLDSSSPPSAKAPASRLPVVHIFGLSQISTFHTELIGRLRERVDFRIYTLNPSADFWEDVRTPREKRWEEGLLGRAAQSATENVGPTASELFSPTDHPLLSLWGKPGREHIRSLCELTGYDFLDSFPPPDRPDTVLGCLQGSMLTLADEDDAPEALAQDRSIQVVGCPGPLREVETVYNRILHQLAQDPALQLTDIAVLVTDMAAYKPLFDTVFQRSPRQLSYNLVDTLAETESHFGRGVLALLDLMTGRFTRREVLGLMMNPLFLARWSVDMEMVAVWARWIEGLNIYHSFDLNEKASRGGGDSPRYTWQQGLRRLRLGRIMDTDGSGAKAAAFHGLLPHQDLESADLPLLERFCLSVEHLHSNVVHLRRLAVKDREWPRIFLSTCAELLPIGPEASGEAAVQTSLLEAFESLALFACLDTDDTRGGAVSPDLLRSFIGTHLRGLSTAHGEYLTGGVTLAALQPMRPIPYQIIYILGMEEGGAFPGRADNSSLDLRLVKRRRGDVSTPERNTYLFLEALLSARRQVVISYVCRDLQKDRDLMPCAPVHQLKRFISDHLLGEGQDFEEQRVPLKSTDPAYLVEAGQTSWADPLTNTNLLDRIIALRTTGAWPPSPENIPADLKAQVAALTAEITVVPPQAVNQAAPVRLFLDELRRFLLNPIHTQLARHLGVRATRPPLEAVLQANDEPFASAFPQDYRMEREALEQWLEACWQGTEAIPTAVDLLDGVYHRQALMGAVPEGVFEHLDRESMRSRVVAAAEALQPLLEELKGAAQRYTHVIVGNTNTATASGSPGKSAAAEGVRHLPPVALEAQSDTQATLELSGELSWVWQDQTGGWHTLVLTGSAGRPSRHPNHHVIAPLLTYLALACGGPNEMGLGEGGLTIHLASRGGVGSFRYRCEAREAHTTLETLAASYLDPQQYRWLPFRMMIKKPFEVQKLMSEEVDDHSRQHFLDTLMEAWDEQGDYLSSLARPRFDLACLDEARRRVAVFFATDEGEA